MQHPHFRRTLVSLALLGTGFTAQAADETMTVVGKRSQHQEVATATRTNTPAKLAPQTFDSVKISELSAENLTDHEYFVSATSATQIMPGTPRQLSLTGTYRF